MVLRHYLLYLIVYASDTVRASLRRGEFRGNFFDFGEQIVDGELQGCLNLQVLEVQFLCFSGERGCELPRECRLVGLFIIVGARAINLAQGLDARQFH